MTGELVIVRHADTDWSETGQHTGRTDLPLNEAGRATALTLAGQLASWRFVAVWSSPLARALETARLAGFDPQRHDELLEWDYGEYEGLTSAQIDRLRPGWDLWRDGCPGGENAAVVARRADAALADLPSEGDVLIFAHGHILRVLTARWLELDAVEGARFLLAPGGIGVLSEDQGRRALRRWQ